MDSSDATTVSWILLAIAFWDKDSVTRAEILHSADAINQAVPSGGELESAIQFLTRQGLIERDGDCFTISDEGRQTLELAGCESGNIFDVWQALEPRVAALGAA